jgi:3',5'-cyclic AMP phosphodiesterase CpdA
MGLSEPLFSFVHATDLHFESGPEPSVPEANARIACLIDDVNALSGPNQPSFVILSGDLTNVGCAREADLVSVKGMCDQLTAPWHAIAGNHDFAPNPEIAARYPGKEDYFDGSFETSPYGRVFGSEGHHFSFSTEGYHFIGFTLRDGDPDGSLDWLKTELDGHPSGPIIVVAHYGLYPPREAGPLNTWGFARVASCLPRLRSMVEKKGSQVVAYLYGHNHINSVLKRDHTYFISGGSLQRGCTGYRVFRCYSDRMEASFRFLSDEALLNFDFWSGDNPAACTDRLHVTAELYHQGTEEERYFTISLPSL